MVVACLSRGKMKNSSQQNSIDLNMGFHLINSHFDVVNCDDAIFSSFLFLFYTKIFAMFSEFRHTNILLCITKFVTQVISKTNEQRKCVRRNSSKLEN